MTHFSETLWYTPMEHHHHYQQHFQQQQQQQQQPKAMPFYYTNNDNNPSGLLSLSSSSYTPNDEDSPTNNRSDITSSSSPADKEHMFEKPLTPSDVGKLNRLVIPKQHAEKYFPLAAAAAAAAEVAADKGATSTGGVLLGFEDETGKCWRFRYSYWNSSQSYVLTKGWSRYVKEKKLDAGDVVLFERHRCEPDRFFIGWRRRGSAAPVQSPAHHFLSPLTSGQRHQVHQRQGYTPSQGIPSPSGFSYQHDHQSFHAAGTDIRHQVTQKTAKSSGGNSRKLRLFGVNLECELEEDLKEEPQTSDGSSLSSQGQGHGSGFGSSSGHMSYNYYDYMGYPPNHHNHMDVNFPQDVNQMRNRLG